MALSRVKSQSLPQQVQSVIEREVRQGGFPGGRLPPEEELARRLGVSRMTLRHAVRPMVESGVLTKVKGKGTFLSAAQSVAARPRTFAQIGCVSWGRFIGPEALTKHEGLYTWVMQGMLEASARHHFGLTFYHTKDLEEAQGMLAGCREGQLDGLILMALPDEEALEALVHRHLPKNYPVMLVDHRSARAPMDCVEVDSFEGTKSAVAHLVALGHREIAFLNWKSAPELNPHRLAGFRAGLEAAGLAYRPEWVVPAAANIKGGAEALGRLLDSGIRPTGLVTFDNQIAKGAQAEAERRGLNVPRDLSLVGFGPYTPYHVLQPLTFVGLDPFEMGRVAVERLLARIANPHLSPKVFLVPTQLHAGRTAATR